MLCTRRTLATYLFLALAAAPILSLSGCSDKVSSSPTANASVAPDNGAPAIPAKLVFGFVPYFEANKIASDAQPIADYLTKELGMPVETFTSTNYTGLVEAMASGKVDIGSLPALGYVLAKDRNAAELLFKTSRQGRLTYHAMFVTRADSGIKRIEDAKGKRMAFVDAASTSGFLFPAAYLKKKGYDYDSFFSKYVFAGSHDGAIRAVYSGDVDVAAAYDDVRDKVEKMPGYADVKKKVIKIGTTDEIPNDTISLRTGLDPALAARIKAALLKYSTTPEGAKVLFKVYGVDKIVPAQDSDYNQVRDVARSMDVQLSTIDSKPKPSPSASPSGK